MKKLRLLTTTLLKKLRLLTTTLLSAMCLLAYSQETIDVGRDWSGSALINPSSGTNLTQNKLEYIFNEGADNEVRFITNGTVPKADNKSVYKNTTSSSITYFYLTTTQTHYLEGRVSDAKKITAVKLNGTSADPNVSHGVTGGILYSDQTPFDENSITGYEVFELAKCRSGNTGVILEGMPDGTKSFRAYRTVKINDEGGTISLASDGEIQVGLENGLVRIAYAAITLVDAGPATEPKLSLTTGPESVDQLSYAGDQMVSISYRFSGTAISASVAWTGTASTSTPPAGINVSSEEGILTISGTPTVAGEYTYFVTATDGDNTTEPLTGKINVIDATNFKKMAYMTDLTKTSMDKPLLDAFKKQYYVTTVSADNTEFDYTDQDIIVLSAIPTSTAAGLLALKNTAITKPFLNMKAFAMQTSNSRWDWLTSPSNTEIQNIVVPEEMKSHKIFEGVTWTGENMDEIQLTTKESGNRVIYYGNWINPSVEPIVLAQVQVGETLHPSFAEVAESTVLNGMAAPTAAPQILYNLSESCWDALTPDAITIALNAVEYVLGDSSVSIEDDFMSAVKKAEVSSEYYDLTGRRISTPKGIVIKKSIYEDGSSSFGKVFIK